MLSGDTISVQDGPSDHDVWLLTQNLIRYNSDKAELENWRPLVITVRDSLGNLVAALNGYTHWHWLFIQRLWVEESRRGQGYGQQLVGLAEREAVTRGCQHAHVDTLSFQAPEFYAKLGYSVFGILEGFPPGHRRYFFEKRNLSPPPKWY